MPDPMDLDQWEFYVVPTPLLNGKPFRESKSISLSTIHNRLKVQAVEFDDLSDAIATAGKSRRRLMLHKSW